MCYRLATDVEAQDERSKLAAISLEIWFRRIAAREVVKCMRDVSQRRCNNLLLRRSHTHTLSRTGWGALLCGDGQIAIINQLWTECILLTASDKHYTRQIDDQDLSFYGIRCWWTTLALETWGDSSLHHDRLEVAQKPPCSVELQYEYIPAICWKCHFH